MQTSGKFRLPISDLQLSDGSIMPSPRLEVGTSRLFAFRSTENFQLGKSSKMDRIGLFVLN